LIRVLLNNLDLMPLYKYSKNSTVSSIRLVKGESGASRAYLKAGESTDAKALSASIQALTKAGYIVSPCNFEGEQLLEVRKFKKFEDIHKVLSAANSVSGEPEKHNLEDDKFSLRKWFKKQSLIVSSLFYLVGDFCYIKYEKVNTGVKETKKHEKREAINAAIRTKGGSESEMMPEIKPHKNNIWDWLAGYGYLTGSSSSLASMIMRGDTSGIELGEISRRVLSAFKDAGVEINENLPIFSTSKLNDTRNPLSRAFQTYSAEMMNLSFATAGLAIAKDNAETAIRLREEEKKYGKYYDFKNDKRHQDDKLVAALDVALGSGTITSGVASSVIKEQPIDVNKPKKDGADGVVDYLKERPLRIAGAGYIVSTIIHLVSSLKERASIQEENKTREESKKFPITHTAWRLGFVIANLVAETIMYFSSKGHGTGVKSDDSIDATTIGMVAQIIHNQPAEMRAELIKRMAPAIAKVDILNIKIETAAELLTAQVAALDANPWSKAFISQNDKPFAESESTSNDVTHHKKIDSGWAEALFQNAKPVNAGVENLFNIATKKQDMPVVG